MSKKKVFFVLTLMIILPIVNNQNLTVLAFSNQETFNNNPFAKITQKSITNCNNQSLPTTITLGASVSITGSLSPQGTEVLNGYNLAIKDINNNGGVIINGSKYMLYFKYYDDASNKDQAKTNINNLINNDGVQFLLGPYGSSNVLSVAPLADQYKIPMVQAGGSSDSIYTQGYQYTFGLYRTASNYTEPIFAYLNNSGNIANIQSVAVFVENEPFSLSVEAGANKFLSAVGLSSSTTNYLHATGDLTTLDNQVSTLNSTGGADLILSIGHYADTKEVVQQITSLGMKPKIVYGAVGVDEPAFITDLGVVANSVMGFSQWDPIIPEAQAPGITTFVQEYNTTYGRVPSYLGAGGYAAVQVLKTALENANSLAPVKVKNQLNNLDTSNVWGKISFKSDGSITGVGNMVQIQNGTIQIVYPANYMTNNVIYPYNTTPQMQASSQTLTGMNLKNNPVQNANLKIEQTQTSCSSTTTTTMSSTSSSKIEPTSLPGLGLISVLVTIGLIFLRRKWKRKEY